MLNQNMRNNLYSLHDRLFINHPTKQNATIEQKKKEWKMIFLQCKQKRFYFRFCWKNEAKNSQKKKKTDTHVYSIHSNTEYGTNDNTHIPSSK